MLPFGVVFIAGLLKRSGTGLGFYRRMCRWRAAAEVDLCLKWRTCRRGSISSNRGQIELWQEQARGRGGARRPEVSSRTWVGMVRQICGEGSQL